MMINEVPMMFAQATQADPRAQTIQMVSMLVLMGVVFYFAMIRPQQKRAKEHAALLKAIKRGDRVATSSGIVALVETVKENTVIIKSEGSKLEILKSAVAEITERGGESKEA